ncbi:MAG: hypothetical protein U0S12_01590 [Fimbriimonadales bacterium]
MNDVYVKNLKACRCARIPNASKSNLFGHALRASMAGHLLGKVPHPESNIMLFDSMDLRMGRSASWKTCRIRLEWAMALSSPTPTGTLCFVRLP